MDDLRAQALELWESYRDASDKAYWWADHAILQSVLVTVLVGAIGLAYQYAGLHLRRSMLTEGA